MPDKELVPIQSPTLVNLKSDAIQDTAEINAHRVTAGDLINRPKILMYHRIVDDESLSQTQETCVHIRKFRKQLELIDRLGYTPVTFDDYRLYQAGEMQLPRKPLILTFDDGYLDTYRFAFPLLEEFGMKGVVFALGDPSVRKNVWDAGTPGISEAQLMDEDHIVELSNHGFEIGGHSLSHPNLANLTEEECLHEVKKTKLVLEAVTGTQIQSFSYPYGRVSRQVKDCVAESGYRYACSVFSGPARFGVDPFEIRRIAVHNTTTIPGLALRLIGPYEYLEWMWWRSRSGILKKHEAWGSGF